MWCTATRCDAAALATSWPDPEPKELRDAIIAGAHELARDIYKRTAHRATVDAGLHPDTFYRIAMTDDGRADFRDYERGRVRVGHDVEISVARELAK